MNTRDKNKLKFIQAFDPNINLDKLEKYTCRYCGNYECRSRGGFYSRFSGQESVDHNQIIRFTQINYPIGIGRIFEIYTCFEGVEKNENNQKQK